MKEVDNLVDLRFVKEVNNLAILVMEQFMILVIAEDIQVVMGGIQVIVADIQVEDSQAVKGDNQFIKVGILVNMVDILAIIVDSLAIMVDIILAIEGDIQGTLVVREDTQVIVVDNQLVDTLVIEEDNQDKGVAVEDRYLTNHIMQDIVVLSKVEHYRVVS